MPPNLPPLEHFRTVLRPGMSPDDFLAACDATLERYTLRVGQVLQSTQLDIAVSNGSVDGSNDLGTYVVAASWIEGP